MILDVVENTWDLSENMGMEDISKTFMGIKGADSTEEVPETQNVDFEGAQVMGASLREMTSL